jgi:hypothetical protein
VALGLFWLGCTYEPGEVLGYSQYPLLLEPAAHDLDCNVGAVIEFRIIC